MFKDDQNVMKYCYRFVRSEAVMGKLNLAKDTF